MSGAPVGNTNSADGRRYRKAMERALAHHAGSVDEGLFAVAKARIAKAIDGDADAAREVGDRFDGKPTQGVEHTGADGGPMAFSVDVRFVRLPELNGSLAAGSIPVSVEFKG